MGIINSHLKKLQYVLSSSALILLFQNCTQSHLTIDENLKSKTLNEKNLFAASEDPVKSASFTFVCPTTKTSDLLHSDDLKVVIESFDYDSNTTSVICQVHNVKKQILDTRTVDLSDCTDIPDAQNANLELFVVPENVESDFDAHKINTATTPLALGGYSLNYMAMDPKAKDAVCDEAGAPLVIQLNNTEQIELTAPTEGISFDLLGTRSYMNPHDKVSTSWFKAGSNNDIYFLVKPNSDHLVLGADEMFADTTRGPDGKYAKQGFAALAKYDDNKDLIISEDDVIFNELRLWKDDNHDGIVQEEELSTLKSKNIVAIDLRYETRLRESDIYGNQSLYKSVVVMADQSYGMIFDLGLRFVHQPPPAPQAAPVLMPEALAEAPVTEAPPAPVMVPEESRAPASISSDEKAANEPVAVPQPEENHVDMSSQTSESHEAEPAPETAPPSAEPAP